ncbi:Pentatricopeptide repeat-containing protein [Acorus calamus]|uniref:Pentatricopeptide repeat-containing protein n=1 Tax=Acorus calamus TaxID=4465 RepID=A0AAV9EK27_ACOCL|nr:Pentatricopeptide repeat-containing protein [Acorus calamus]
MRVALKCFSRRSFSRWRGRIDGPHRDVQRYKYLLRRPIVAPLPPPHSSDVHPSLNPLCPPTARRISDHHHHPHLTHIDVERLCISGAVSEASRLLLDLRDRDAHLSLRSYNAVLRAAASAGDVSLSLEVFKDLLKTRLKPDSETYASVASAFTSGDDHSESLRGLARDVSAIVGENLHALNRLMHAFAVSGQTEKAMDLFEQMEGPDVVTYNTVLAALGEAGWVEEMLAVFARMEGGPGPDIVTYNTVINGLRKAGRADLFGRLVGEMRERGIELELRTYTAVIDGLGRAGRVEEALRVFGEMKKRRVRASVYVYRGLIRGLRKAGKEELADCLEAEMKACASKLVGPWDFKRKK